MTKVRDDRGAPSFRYLTPLPQMVADQRGSVLDTVRRRGTYIHGVAHTRAWVALAAGFNLWLHNPDRDTSPPVLTFDMGRIAFDPISSPDDASLAFRENSGNLAYARVSPAGRRIAYVSTDAGVPAVYVRRFLASGRAIRLTSGGARSPRWRADGPEFCYQTSDDPNSVPDLRP